MRICLFDNYFLSTIFLYFLSARFKLARILIGITTKQSHRTELDLQEQFEASGLANNLLIEAVQCIYLVCDLGGVEWIKEKMSVSVCTRNTVWLTFEITRNGIGATRFPSFHYSCK